jgi:hypothetical protein
VSNPESDAGASSKPKLSLDTWAVLVALAAAVLIRLGLIHIPW